MTYEAQLARGEFEPVAMIGEKRISAVLKTPWAADGKNFSQRLWTSREQLIGTLQAELTRALITGADSKSVAKTIAQKMNAAEYAASRLVQTEITRIITESDKDTFAEMNIDEVEIVGTLDGHTCGTCGDMDGKYMPRSEAHAGTTAPPFHPNCRCVIVPYFGDEEETGKRVMRDPETGKSKIVENMTFKEWKEKYGGGNAPKNVASKATQNVANSGTISVQRPAGEQDILKKFSYIGNQKTAAERLAAVNPHYGEGFEWKNNCQRCVVAEELQARGYNVTAKPFANDGIGDDGTACWNIDWANRQNDAGYIPVPLKSQFKSIVQKAFSTWGGNARAVVRVEWTAIAGGREGHFFSVHMENGQIIYTDPQINEIRDIDETLKDCTPSPYRMWVMRVDNRELTDLVEEAVENI